MSIENTCVCVCVCVCVCDTMDLLEAQRIRHNLLVCQLSTIHITYTLSLATLLAANE